MKKALNILDQIAETQCKVEVIKVATSEVKTGNGTGFDGPVDRLTDQLGIKEIRTKAIEQQSLLDSELESGLLMLISSFESQSYDFATVLSDLHESSGLKWVTNYLLVNDSLLDIDNRRGVYNALLSFLTTVHSHPETKLYVDDNLCSLLHGLTESAKAYLQLNQQIKQEESDDNEVVSLLQLSKHIVETYTSVTMGNKYDMHTVKWEDAYLHALGPLRFAAISMCDMITSGSTQHLLLRQQVAAGDAGVVGDARKRLARVACEMSGLSSSLPVELGSSIFVRCDESRMDVLKALIVGPEGTPYANGLFEFDILLPPAYPSVPPQILLVTTGGGSVRFNPNLYNCGKVCLSLLGTWAGPGWDPKESTLLQVLVSIQSLILVPDPYFNEPGYEALQNTPSGTLQSDRYNANIRTQTVRYGIIDQMMKPSPVFKEVIELHFYHKRDEILKQVQQWGGDVLGVTAALESMKKEIESKMNA